MLGIGGTELFIILVFAFLVFGPDKMPQIGRTLGRAIRQFRNAQEEMNRVVRQEVYDPLNDDEPLGDSLKGIFKEFTGEADKTPQPKAVLSSAEAADQKPAPEASSEGSHDASAHDVSSVDGSQQELGSSAGTPPEGAAQAVNADVVVKRPVKGESFAQKKARLAREKAERERLRKEGSSKASSTGSASSSQEVSSHASAAKDGE